MDIEILFEDNDVLVVNKPAGLLVIPDRFNSDLPSLNRMLELHTGNKIWVVHRLDRDTSGVICFAKNEDVHRHLSILFSQNSIRGIDNKDSGNLPEVKKQYLGIAVGQVTPQIGKIDAPIAEHHFTKGKMVVNKRGKVAVTEYEVLDHWFFYSLVKFKLLTGRTHQIRVHMQSIGHPIVCDELYGDGKPFFLSSVKKKYRLSEKEDAEKPLLKRLALHSSSLEFEKEDGQVIKVEAPLPKDIGACVKQLHKWGLKPEKKEVE